MKERLELAWKGERFGASGRIKQAALRGVEPFLFLIFVVKAICMSFGSFLPRESESDQRLIITIPVFVLGFYSYWWLGILS